MTQRRRILVVDDEAQIRRVLRAYLEADGFGVDEAGSGTQALEVFGHVDPVLILLDVGLPDMDGMEVLRRMRATSEVYIILVTARSEELDKLVGLTIGADDYVTKPFSPREVVARVNTVLRRDRSGPRAALAPHAARLEELRRFPGLTVDARSREIHVDGAEVSLSTLEFDLLWALAEDCGRVFSRAQLLERVWGYDFYGDERVVDVHVRNIRRVLHDDAARPRIIGTVRGVGYKFLLQPLAQGAAAPPVASPVTQPAEQPAEELAVPPVEESREWPRTPATPGA
ncbi:MAG: response regulator transcription factor [Austwickia sp.]|nr:response regulator transcription factor [Austwickia sp.]